jgi:hypothetical protein
VQLYAAAEKPLLRLLHQQSGQRGYAARLPRAQGLVQRNSAGANA